MNTTISAVTMVTANVGLGAVHAPGCVPEAEGMSPARDVRVSLARRSENTSRKRMVQI